jgi:hypothetical protein
MFAFIETPTSRFKETTTSAVIVQITDWKFTNRGLFQSLNL